ncbi:hypothetical protein NUSPORA_00959 [Nucleospora cyclopteri]
METLTIDQAILNSSPATLKLTQEGVGIKTMSENFSIKKEQIKNMELFRGIKKYCLRICLETAVYDLLNIDESSLPKIRSAISSSYGLTLSNTDLEVLNTTEGNFVFNNNILSLHGEKPILSIPKNSIEKIIEIENELQFNLGDVEIVFNTSSNVTSFLKNKVAEEICVMSNITCISPRSKSVLLLFDNYLEARGSSYDHSIFYKDIKDLLFLSSGENDFYMVLRLHNPVVQGQTKYESMVFSLDKKEIEVAAKDPRLNEYYKGEQADVVIEIIESMLDCKAQVSDLYMRCTNKINEGILFFLNNTLQFLPKSATIGVDSILLVEFSRLNVSAMQAKTFDMVIHADKIYNFTGISKEHFTSIESYFHEKGIKMVSEVVEDEFSSGSNNEDSDDDSDVLSIIAGSDED